MHDDMDDEWPCSEYDISEKSFNEIIDNESRRSKDVRAHNIKKEC